jgi:hypothetical protein
MARALAIAVSKVMTLIPCCDCAEPTPSDAEVVAAGAEEVVVDMVVDNSQRRR